MAVHPQLSSAQTAPPPAIEPAAAAPVAPTPLASAEAVKAVLPVGTRLQLATLQHLTTIDNKLGDSFGIVVVEDVSQDGTIVIPKGQIRQAFAELLGINASKGLLLLLSDSNKETSLRCGLADFKVAKGVMTAQQVVFDTGVVLAKGSGTIDLETERMDLRLDGDSKKARLVRLFAPITLKGPLSQPKVGVELGRVAAQGGLAALLSGLLGPLGALLPFVEPGLEKNTDCIALMQEARTNTAPVRITTAITTELPKTARILKRPTQLVVLMRSCAMPLPDLLKTAPMISRSGLKWHQRTFTRL